MVLTDRPHKRKDGYFFRLGRNIRVQYELYLLILPALVYFIIFKYIPMYGVQIAFRDYIPGLSFFKAPWVGLYNFQRLFRSYMFVPILTNTLRISLLSIVLGFPFPIILAVMLNELGSLKLKKTVQTISYAPHFISTVAMAGIILVFLSERGLFNAILSALGSEKILFMGKPRFFAWIYVLGGIWQNSGWGSIIYFAALAAVDMELYEAARIDGANKLQKIRHIDLPSIMPTMVILLILRVGQIMNVGFEQILLLQNSLNTSHSEIISTYVYKVGLQSASADFSYSTAIGLFNSVINLILLYSVNLVSRKVNETSLW